MLKLTTRERVYYELAEDLFDFFRKYHGLRGDKTMNADQARSAALEAAASWWE